MDLIPQPRDCRIDAAHTLPLGLPARIHPDHLTRPALRALLESLPLSLSGDPTVPRQVLLAGSAAAPESRPGHPQGFRVTVDQEGLSVVGGSEQGLRYGLHCLAQLAAGRERLPALQIEDEPAFDLRVHHDDISRGQISTVEDFRTLIDGLDRYRFNGYTWYIEDTLHLPSFPEIGEGRGKLMPEEVRELVAYAAERGITLFPTISLIGHHHNLLALPGYARLGAPVFQPDSAFNVRDPAVREFLSRVLDDVCELFPSQWFHMCFDEVIGLGADEMLEHANWCAEQLVARGKTPIMWIDMFQNHFGMDALRQIHPAVIACGWCYDADSLCARRAGDVRASLAQRTTWGLSGYGSTCEILAPLEPGARCHAAWAELLRDQPGSVIQSSIWGDNGYENQRQGQWQRYACFAEVAWCGEPREDFPRRFVAGHWGLEDAALQEVVAGPECLGEAALRAIGCSAQHLPSRLWRLFRQPHAALVRLLGYEPELASLAETALPALERLADRLRPLVHQAPRRGEEIDLHLLELERAMLVLSRIRSAHEHGERLPAAVADGLRTRIEGLRRRYRQLWLRHNRAENLAESDGVYALLLEDLAEATVGPAPQDPVCCCLPLPAELARFTADLAGVPIGRSRRSGISVPFPRAGLPVAVGKRLATDFRFAAREHTHYELAPEAVCELAFPRQAIRDIELVATTPKGDGQPRPALELELLREGAVVFRETLASITHLCDWWAPRGTHMWAGGGLAYVDPQRVRPVLDLPQYTLCAIARFPFIGEISADAIRLRALGSHPVQCFALTLVRAPDFLAEGEAAEAAPGEGLALSR